MRKQSSKLALAPRDGFEPSTNRLTVASQVLWRTRDMALLSRRFFRLTCRKRLQHRHFFNLQRIATDSERSRPIAFERALAYPRGTEWKYGFRPTGFPSVPNAAGTSHRPVLCDRQATWLAH